VRILLPLITFLILAVAGTSEGQVYKWTDKDAKVHYGDRPPADSKTEQVKVPVQSFGGPAEVDYVSILRRPIKSDARQTRADVIIYSAAWCGPCKRAKAWMASQNIPFADYDVETSEQGKKDFAAMGGRGVPMILVGEQRMTGFSAGGLKTLLTKAGY
jgi:glutaredoxin